MLPLIQTCLNLTALLRQGLGMILPEDGGPPRPEASTLPHAKPLEKAEKQSAEDEDEEQEGELSGSTTMFARLINSSCSTN